MEILDIRHNERHNINDEYVIAIGNFDGIHKAHRKVIKQAVKIAKKEKLKVAVMTFDMPPRQLINNINNYYVLRSFEQKKAILAQLGVDCIFLIHFNKAFASMSAHDFVDNVIINHNIKHIVCGFDYHFGKNKSGNVEMLQEYNEFKTTILKKELVKEQKVGTTLINELLMHGEITKANKLLVDPYSIIGKVIYGNQKGRTIGFPTANILPVVNYRILQNGVYATKVIYNGKSYLGMSNIGHNPTFNYCTTASIETHIYDFNEMIYDQEIEVVFYKMIRKEKIFEGVQQLVDQLEIDMKNIKEYFKGLDNEL